MRRKILRFAFSLIVTLPAFAFEVPATLAPLTSHEGAYVIGHLSPDSDSIMGAIAAAHLYKAVAARTGDINPESQYLLERFNLSAPVLLDDLAGKKFILVDFNQRTQAPAGLDASQVIAIIDHHAVQSAFIGPQFPVAVDIRPWGSACTILADLYLRNHVAIPKDIAGALLGGIVSDTLNLTSPTTTDADRNAIALLSRIAEIEDVSMFAKELFRAKSRISHLKPKELVQLDFKIFDVAKAKIGIGVAETLFFDEIATRHAEIVAAMLDIREEKQLSHLFFGVINPETKESYLLLPSEKEKSVARLAFGKEVEGQIVRTTPMVSRKLELLPKIQKALESVH